MVIRTGFAALFLLAASQASAAGTPAIPANAKLFCESLAKMTSGAATAKANGTPKEVTMKQVSDAIAASATDPATAKAAIQLNNMVTEKIYTSPDTLTPEQWKENTYKSCIQKILNEQKLK